MEENKSIRERCHVNTNEDGDRFVGIKADTDDAIVYFPVGYELPENEDEIRRDIKHLFSILGEFTEKKDRVLQMKKFEIAQSVNFPINAYLDIINYYLDQNGKYYTETEPIYKTGTKGRTDWGRTFKQQKPLVQQNGSPIYTKRTVRTSTPNENRLITHIHKYCVYESFDKLGWLYMPNMPEKSEMDFDKKRFIIALNDKLAHTNNDKDKRLFKSMIDMIEFLDEQTQEKQYYFGTDYFEGVWEKLIDKVFGVSNKQEYFPRAKWTLRNGKYKSRDKYPLEPDSIMILGDKYYVLDAKYYRYGDSGLPDHLPNSSDINKQITYGQYIHTSKKVPNEKLFNAFLMPFNMFKNEFGITSPFGNIGEATGDWRGDNQLNYERIQGVVVDVRYLMYLNTGCSTRTIDELAKAIEFGLQNPIQKDH